MSLGLIIIGWLLVYLLSNRDYRIREIFHFVPSEIFAILANIYNLLIPISIIIVFLLLIINIIKGIIVTTLLKINVDQEDIKNLISKKIRRINRVFKVCIITSMIIFIPLSPLIFMLEKKPKINIYENCIPGTLIEYKKGNPIFCE